MWTNNYPFASWVQSSHLLIKIAQSHLVRKYYFVCVLLSITVYSKKKRKKWCLSHIDCMCLASAVYNPVLKKKKKSKKILK